VSPLLGTGAGVGAGIATATAAEGAGAGAATTGVAVAAVDVEGFAGLTADGIVELVGAVSAKEVEVAKTPIINPKPRVIEANIFFMMFSF
jgi:hypothetical protein